MLAARGDHGRRDRQASGFLLAGQQVQHAGIGPEEGRAERVELVHELIQRCHHRQQPREAAPDRTCPEPVLQEGLGQEVAAGGVDRHLAAAQPQHPPPLTPRHRSDAADGGDRRRDPTRLGVEQHERGRPRRARRGRDQIATQKGLADPRRVAEELLDTGAGDGRVGDPVIEPLHHLRLGDRRQIDQPDRARGGQAAQRRPVVGRPGASAVEQSAQPTLLAALDVRAHRHGPHATHPRPPPAVRAARRTRPTRARQVVRL